MENLEFVIGGTVGEYFVNVYDRRFMGHSYLCANMIVNACYHFYSTIEEAFSAIEHFKQSHIDDVEVATDPTKKVGVCVHTKNDEEYEIAMKYFEERGFYRTVMTPSDAGKWYYCDSDYKLITWACEFDSRYTDITQEVLKKPKEKTQLEILEEQLKEAQETIAKLKAEQSPKEPEIVKWEPTHGIWTLNAYDLRPFMSHTYDKSRINGYEYQTKEQAEWARDHMRRFNRLLAYVAEFDVDNNGVQWKPDWGKQGQEKCTVHYLNHAKKWDIQEVYTVQGIDVHMSKKCAEGLVKKLNSGEVTL